MMMKVMYSLLMVFLFVAMPVLAQGQESKAATDFVTKLQPRLNLTEDQMTAITPIIKKYMSKRKELQQSAQDGTIDRSTVHAQMGQLREDQNQELYQILSINQMDQWRNMQNHTQPTTGGAGDSSGFGV